jgi:hypothetical protein
MFRYTLLHFRVVVCVLILHGKKGSYSVVQKGTSSQLKKAFGTTYRTQ